jgi:phosphohistidine swiveling domain-containing protein
MTMSSSLVGGKAKNLAILSSIPGISVPQFTVVPAGLSWPECEAIIRSFLHDRPHMKEVAVRSSAVNEDAHDASFAGMYATKLRIPACVENILSAVEEVRNGGTAKEAVVAHYVARRGLESAAADMAVVVQEMVAAEFSGIIFSHGLSVRDGYYLVSTAPGLGEIVASGSVNGQLIRIARGTDLDHLHDAWLRELIIAMRTIELHMGSQSLDVEFAYENGRLYVLQCRPIVTSHATHIDVKDEELLDRQLEALNAHIRVHFEGDVLADMSDINPLELLGAHPSKLDISIFKYLFADTIVERVRRDMGYDPLDAGLIREVGSKPYVSLRASAFSFRPQGIPTQTYEKMFAVYRDMLRAQPDLQDRVEFEVFAMRCGDKLEDIMDAAGMTEAEKMATREAFQRLDMALAPVSDTCKASFAEKITRYRQVTNGISAASLQEMLAHVASGTELFVRVARLAFYWKNRFEEIYSGSDLNELLVGHIQSVSSRLQTDMFLCREGRLSRNELVGRYGHLRPGQFSVFGESYADDPDHYLFDQLHRANDQRIGKRVHSHENTPEFKNVVAFMQAREETKFLFSRSLGVFVESLKSALRALGITHADASQCTWSELEAVLCNEGPMTSGREDRLPMILPEVIIPGLSDLKVVASGTASPTYITRAVVKARVCVLENPSSHADVSGAIVLIPSADPGYDFLFHSGVAGIITKTGGPASHMCIRSVELQVPSCIGCGEQMYNTLSSVHSAVLDCQTGQIVVPE